MRRLIWTWNWIRAVITWVIIPIYISLVALWFLISLIKNGFEKMAEWLGLFIEWWCNESWRIRTLNRLSCKECGNSKFKIRWKEKTCTCIKCNALYRLLVEEKELERIPPEETENKETEDEGA